MQLIINFERQWIGVKNYDKATKDEIEELNWLEKNGKFTIIKL